jgi:hypothetical protein
MAQDRDRWRAVVNAVMNRGVSKYTQLTDVDHGLGDQRKAQNCSSVFVCEGFVCGVWNETGCLSSEVHYKTLQELH